MYIEAVHGYFSLHHNDIFQHISSISGYDCQSCVFMVNVLVYREYAPIKKDLWFNRLMMIKRQVKKVNALVKKRFFNSLHISVVQKFQRSFSYSC